MIVAILARLRGNPFYQFAMYPGLIYFLMIFGIFTLKTPAVRYTAPISRLFSFLQEQGFGKGFDWLVWVPFEMFSQQSERGYVHLHPSVKSRVKMATCTIVMVLRSTGFPPFLYRISHLMADYAGLFLKIPDGKFMRSQAHCREQKYYQKNSELFSGFEKISALQYKSPKFYYKIHNTKLLRVSQTSEVFETSEVFFSRLFGKTMCYNAVSGKRNRPDLIIGVGPGEPLEL